MLNSATMFAVEKDEFCSNEKIDEKWTELAKSLINENMDEKEEMLKDLYVLVIPVRLPNSLEL